MSEFPGRNLSLASAKRLVDQIDTTRFADCKSDSGQRHTACSGTNIELVEELKVYFVEISYRCLKYMWLSLGKVVFNLMKF